MKVRLPDKNLVLDFPDGMTEDQMRDAIYRNFYPEKLGAQGTAPTVAQAPAPALTSPAPVLSAQPTQPENSLFAPRGLVSGLMGHAYNEPVKTADPAAADYWDATTLGNALLKGMSENRIKKAARTDPVAANAFRQVEERTRPLNVLELGIAALSDPSLLDVPAGREQIEAAETARGYEAARHAEALRQSAKWWDPGEYHVPTEGVGRVLHDLAVNAPYTLSNMPAAVLATMALGPAGAFIGGIPGALGEGLDEGADVYRRLIEKGVNPDEAYQRYLSHADKVGLGLMVSDPLQNMATFGLGKLFPNAGAVTRTLGGLAFNMASEGAEEILEGVAANRAVGDPNDWSELGYEGLIGALSGGLFGGGGMAVNAVADALANRVAPTPHTPSSAPVAEVLEELRKEADARQELPPKVRGELLRWARDETARMTEEAQFTEGGTPENPLSEADLVRYQAIQDAMERKDFAALEAMRGEMPAALKQEPASPLVELPEGYALESGKPFSEGVPEDFVLRNGERAWGHVTEELSGGREDVPIGDIRRQENKSRSLRSGPPAPEPAPASLASNVPLSDPERDIDWRYENRDSAMNIASAPSPVNPSSFTMKNGAQVDFAPDGGATLTLPNEARTVKEFGSRNEMKEWMGKHYPGGLRDLLQWEARQTGNPSVRSAPEHDPTVLDIDESAIQGVPDDDDDLEGYEQRGAGTARTAPPQAKDSGRARTMEELDRLGRDIEERMIAAGRPVEEAKAMGLLASEFAGRFAERTNTRPEEALNVQFKRSEWDETKGGEGYNQTSPRQSPDYDPSDPKTWPPSAERDEAIQLDAWTSFEPDGFIEDWPESTEKTEALALQKESDEIEAWIDSFPKEEILRRIYNDDPELDRKYSRVDEIDRHIKKLSRVLEKKKPKGAQRRLTQLIDAEEAAAARELGEEYYQSAYHGSPHRFDRFSLDKIGTGEGNQTFGWGLYFAENKQVSEAYRQNLSMEHVAYFDIDGENLSNELVALSRKRPSDKRALENPILEAKVLLAKEMKKTPQEKAFMREVLDDIIMHYQDKVQQAIYDVHAFGGDLNSKSILADKRALKWLKSINVKNYPEGQLYQVDVPENNVLLNLETTFDEQPKAVQEALQPFIDAYNETGGERGLDITPDIKGIDYLLSVARGINMGKISPDGNLGIGKPTIPKVTYDDKTVSMFLKNTVSQAFGIWTRGAADPVRALTISSFGTRTL